MGCNISVDETMVGFRGRFAAKQYMPKKPQKWGIKAFMLADSSTGYINNFLMYMGSETLEGASSTFSHLLQPALVVMELMEPYLGRGHHLFTNRYYTSYSVQMAKALYDHRTAFTGVSKKNRTEFLDEIRQLQRMLGGEVFAYCCSELLALAWQAEKRKTPVIMLSTQPSAEIVTVQPSNTHPPPSNKPAVTNLYNHNM